MKFKYSLELDCTNVDAALSKLIDHKIITTEAALDYCENDHDMVLDATFETDYFDNDSIYIETKCEKKIRMATKRMILANRIEVRRFASPKGRVLAAKLRRGAERLMRVELVDLTRQDAVNHLIECFYND